MEEVDGDDTDKVRSLEMDDIGEVFQSELPVTTEEIVEEYGDRVVEYPGGDSETLESILETSGEEEYTSMDELELAVLNGVGRDAVGRPRYSDRGDEVEQEFERSDQSF